MRACERLSSHQLGQLVTSPSHHVGARGTSPARMRESDRGTGGEARGNVGIKEDQLALIVFSCRSRIVDNCNDLGYRPILLILLAIACIVINCVLPVFNKEYDDDDDESK